MKRLVGQCVICEGQFNGGEIEPGTFHGGEIEPGTFHTQIAPKNSNPDEKNVSCDNAEMPDLDNEDKEQETRLGPDVVCY